MRLVQDAWFLGVRIARSYLRQPVWIVVALVQPVIWLTLYGQLFRRVVEIPGFGAATYIQFLTPGVAVMTALFNSVWAGFDTLEDMERGILDRFLATPVRRGALILASVGYASSAVAVQVLLILALGSLLGAHLTGGVVGVLLSLAACVLLSATFAAFSNAAALWVRKREPLIAVVNFLSLPLTFLSAAIMPTTLMPSWMLRAARFNPVNWAVEVVRAALAGHVSWGDAADLARLAGLALALFLAALISLEAFRRRV
ncbi:MAG: ABC transporter permease [Thermaerobacter sp.]|jgi:ABC-2 type transport system permease protein|nr:ABC transporter permease [Thermaerobacter sp.]MDA8145892.1 ABC transporter permease [Thermaerobacter sp.]